MSLKTCKRCSGTGLVEDARRNISEADETRIRKLATQGRQQKLLAKEWGLSESQISRLVNK